MNDEKFIARSYSQDDQICQQNNSTSKSKTLREVNMSSENFSTDSNCSMIISVMPLKDREKQGRRSISNDLCRVNTIKYSIPSTLATPISNLASENDACNKLNREPMFPRLVSRVSTKVVLKKDT